MDKKLNQLLTEAQDILIDRPYDAAHDLDHHRQVWTNAQEIVKKITPALIKKMDIDLTALHIAAMWHDAVVGRKLLNRNKIKQQTAVYVKKRMHELEFLPDTIAKATTAILQHSATDTQTIIESKILADADKFEWMNVKRFKHLHHEITTGKLSKIKILAYKYVLKKLLKKLYNKMHFAVSQEIFQQKTNQFKTNPDIMRMVADLGENLESFF